ncbi:MAG TPA: peptidoglycan-binding protein, partial [Methylomirabilota bacterium]|nr:peptidoglycan-binding protein [Methylomirabilota bacterium]
DADGKFAGLAQLKPVVVAGSTSGTPPQAALVPTDAIRDFLKANGVSATGTSTDAKASVVRVICVRK